MAKQLSFDLPAKSAHGREDFFVSAANAQAVALIDTWESWPARKLVLHGPPGAGKTHLAHVWSAQSGATIVAAGDLPGADIPALAHGHVAVEDCETIAANETDGVGRWPTNRGRGSRRGNRHRLRRPNRACSSASPRFQ